MPFWKKSAFTNQMIFVLFSLQFYPAALLLGLTLFMGGLMVKAWGIFLFNKYNNGSKSVSKFYGYKYHFETVKMICESIF